MSDKLIQMAREFVQPEGWQHLKCYGYAPGNYMSKCHRCGQVADDVDKRAITCHTCAQERFYADKLAAFRAAVLADVGDVEPVARVRIHMTGGNAGLAWSAVPTEDAPLMRGGELLYSAATVAALVAKTDVLLEALEFAAKAVSEYRRQGAPTAYWDDVEEKVRAAIAAGGKT